jgi:hypothetical protein
MHERHEVEQYVYLPETSERLASFVAGFPRPCCLCAPTVGVALAQRRVSARVLEIDERFAPTPGFRRWDLYRLQPLDETFGCILCDPPFLKVSLAQLFAALRVLSQGATSQPILLCYPRERAVHLLATFAPFGLRPTGFCPRYQTVQAHGPEDIEVFGNLSDEQHRQLRTNAGS